VRGVCLFGSAARGDDDSASDLDILVVLEDGEDRERLREEARTIRAGLPPSAQLCVLGERRLRENFTGRTVFAAHLAREGRIIADPEGMLTRLIDDFPRGEPVLESSAHLRSQLEVYADLAWCGGYYLFCLADLYAWGRSGAMLAIARSGHFEFGRNRVFERLGTLYPDLAEPAATIEALRPFWERVNRKGSSPLPFPPRGSDTQAEVARDACSKILEVGQ
jgi:hypothetical protein